MSTEFLLPVRVYIEDTDAAHWYYVNYLKYFERCRTELMRALGTERAAISESGWMFVVSDRCLIDSPRIWMMSYRPRLRSPLWVRPSFFNR